jgi:hypothetical protein
MANSMSPIGHSAIAMAAKRFAPDVSLGVLILAANFQDILATILAHAGIEGTVRTGNPWSHGLFMNVCWTILAGVLALGVYRSRRAAILVGIAVFSHWVLDLITHPIPMASFSFRTWRWDYGHPLISDITLFFSSSPRMGFGLYNSISALQATFLEVCMLFMGIAIYIGYRARKKRRRLA